MKGTANYGPDQTKYDRLFSIIIGIDEYSPDKSDLDPLQFAVNDAREIRNTLRDEFGFSEPYSVFLTNQAAKQSAIRNAFRQIAAHKPKANDALLLFFSGHGLIDRKTDDGYLAAIDSRRGDWSTCLSVTEIYDMVKSLHCRHKLIILDSCYSGTLFKKLETRDAPPDSQPVTGQVPSEELSNNAAVRTRGGPSTGFSPLLDCFREPCFVGISAGRITPVADGLGEHSHSIFTAALLQEIKDRAGSERPDQVFTFRQLAARVEGRVRDLPGSQQRPDSGYLDAGNGDFVFTPTIKRVTPRELVNRRDYIGRIGVINQEWRARNVTQAIKLLDECMLDLRHWEWRFLKRASEGWGVTIPDAHGPVAFSPDGTRIAAIAGDKTPTIWELQTGRVVLGLSGFDGLIASLTFSHDGTRIVAASGLELAAGGHLRPGQLQVWNAQDGKTIFRIRNGTEGFLSAAFSPDGNSLATAFQAVGGASGIRILDTASGTLRLTADNVVPTSFHHVAYSPNGKRVAASGMSFYDRSVCIWETSSGKRVGKLSGFNEDPTVVEFSSDGQRIATGDKEGFVKFWDAETGKEVLSFQASQTGIRGLRFQSGGNLLVTADLLGPVRLWNADTGSEVASIQSHRGQDVAFSSDGMQLAIGSDNSGVTVCRLGSGREARDIVGHRGIIKCLAFNSDGTRLASGGTATSGRRGEVKVWDVATGHESLSNDHNVVVIEGHVGDVNSIVFSHDDRWLASLGDDMKVRIWDLKLGAGTEVHALQSPNKETTTLMFSTHGTYLCSASNKHIDVWDSTTGNIVLSVDVDASGVAFLADEQAIVVLGKRNRIFNILTGVEDAVSSERLSGCHFAGVFPNYVSLDGSFRATISHAQNAIELRQLAGSKESFLLRGHTDWRLSAAFSPDGKRMVSAGGHDRTLRIWDTAIGEQIFTFRVDEDDVRNVTFSPDGHRIAAVVGLNSVKMFDAANSEAPQNSSHKEGIVSLNSETRPIPLEEIRQFIGHTDNIFCVAVASDGRLFSCGADRSLRAWNLEKDSAKEDAIVRMESGNIISMALAPDGKTLALVDSDSFLRLLDVTKNAPSVKYPAIPLLVSKALAVTFIRDDSTLVYGNADGTCGILELGGPGRSQQKANDPNSSKVQNPFEFVGVPGPVRLLAGSSDSKTVATVASPIGMKLPPGDIQFWDVESKRLISKCRVHPTEVLAAVFSPNGKMLATASDEGRIRLWEFNNQKLRLAATLKGHSKAVRCLAFSVDNNRLVSGSDDKSVRLWDVSGGRQLFQGMGHSRPVLCVSFVRDGVISGGQDKTLRLWRIPK